MRALAILAFAVGLLPTGAHADGVRVKNEIDLRQLVAKSEVIVTATIEKARPKWASREAYSQSHEYVASFHFQVRIDKWLKGQRQELPAWISHRGDPIPGKWMLIEEAYASQFSPHDAKPGQRVILFLSRPTSRSITIEAGQDRQEISAKEIEDIALLPEVEKALTQSPSTPAQKSRSR